MAAVSQVLMPGNNICVVARLRSIMGRQSHWHKGLSLEIDVMHKGFFQVPDVQFDLEKTKDALQEVDSKLARQSPLGERDINAICLAQIPGERN